MYANEQSKQTGGGAIGLSNQANMVGSGMAAGCAEARQSAKGVLRDRVRRLRGDADRLEALANALPEVLPMEADSALWQLLIDKR